MATKRKPIALPDKLSALIRLAVSDARKVQRMKARTLNMFVWHAPDGTGETCSVCMAGAVMDRSLGADPRRYLDPTDFSGATVGKLDAVNSARIGYLRFAVQDMGIRIRDAQRAVLIDAGELIHKHLGASGRAPWHIYLKAADMLEAVGL